MTGLSSRFYMVDWCYLIVQSTTDSMIPYMGKLAKVIRQSGDTDSLIFEVL